MAGNYMRDGSLSSWSALPPYHEVYPIKINDGQIYNTAYTRNNAYLMTIDERRSVNIGCGSYLHFNRSLALKQFRINAYTYPVKSYAIEARVNGVWVRVRDYFVRPTDYDPFPAFHGWIAINFNVTGSISSDEWKIYITDFDDTVNQNYYAFELEVYDRLSSTGVLMTYKNGEWIAPYNGLRYENGVWVRDSGGIAWEDGDWIDFV